MTRYSRRQVLHAGGAGCVLGLLTACTLQSDGPVTSLSLNIAKIQAYAQAGYNFSQMLLSIPVVAQQLGEAGCAFVKTVGLNIHTALDALIATAGGALTVSYNNASVKTAFQSILSDIQMLVSQAANILNTEDKSDSASQKIQIALTAAQTIVSLMLAMIRSSVGAKAVRRAMDEHEALHSLGVDCPA